MAQRARKRAGDLLRAAVRSPTAHVVLLVAGLLIGSAVLWRAAHMGLTGTGLVPGVPWPVLAVLFALAEVSVLHVQVRREAQAISLSEIPLVLGLFFVSPGHLLLARLVGSLAVLAVHRRQAPLKLLYNTAAVLAGSVLALTVFHAVAGPRPGAGPDAWLVAYLAVAAAGVLDATATSLVIALYERSLRVTTVVRESLAGAPISVAVGTVGLVAVTALREDGRTAYLLVAVLALLLVGFRAYASLSERHLSLERLYRFSQVVTSSPEVDEVLRSILVQAKELLRSEFAEIVFLTPDRKEAGLRVGLSRANRLVRGTGDDLALPGSVWARVVGSSLPALLPRGSRNEDLRTYLHRREMREAIVAPLRGDAGVVGVMLVADRMGDVRTFDADDVRLLETVANHAGVALENSQLIERLRHDAMHDGLTELPNRALLQRRTLEALDSMAMGSLPGLAVMIMDLDSFKEVNDTLGHQHGDALLVEIGTRLAMTAGPDATVARLGGDEFAVLFPGAAEPDTALELGRQLLRALEQPVSLNELDIEVGASLGVALAPEHACDVSGLLKRADIAMYAAKGSTGGLRLYEPAMDTSSPQRLALVGELRQAIALDQLVVFVQPKATLSDGKVTDVEALVRWQHPVHGLLPPDEFVPVAERSGLIRPLTMTVLRTALAACERWRAAGIQVGMAVNLSARSLLDLGLADDVERLLRTHHLPAGMLTLEITESSIMTDPNRTIGLLVRLSEMGVQLSVDDFGTGYSSLSYLKRLPVHEVKIDRSFVTAMDTDADDAAIVRSIVDLGANLSLRVVAEGVEQPATWQRLAELGCDSAQGYLLSRPMPTGDFPEWLAAYDAGRRSSGGPAFRLASAGSAASAGIRSA